MPTAAEQCVYRYADAVTRGDPEAAIAECDPHVEFCSVLAALEGRAFYGAAGIREYFKEIAAAWDEWRVELERVEEAPDGRVAVAMSMRLRGQASGVAFERRLGHLWEMRGGKLWRLTPYDDPDEPFRVAGLV
jgi:ketosteroid isomerase-like protein